MLEIDLSETAGTDDCEFLLYDNDSSVDSKTSVSFGFQNGSQTSLGSLECQYQHLVVAKFSTKEQDIGL